MKNRKNDNNTEILKKERENERINGRRDREWK